MNFKELRENSLRLTFAYSIAGTEIPDTYNNQEDYVKAIPHLANSAMMEIATTVKKIPEITLLENLAVLQELPMGKVYELPSDCYKINGNALIRFNEEHSQFIADRVGFFRQYGDGKILVPEHLGDDLCIEYYRYPRKISNDTSDNVQLDNSLDTHEAIPFYVAAHLVQYDDSFRYASLYNEYRTKLNELSQTTIFEPTAIIDAYGGFGGCY